MGRNISKRNIMKSETYGFKPHLDFLMSSKLLHFSLQWRWLFYWVAFNLNRFIFQSVSINLEIQRFNNKNILRSELKSFARFYVLLNYSFNYRCFSFKVVSKKLNNKPSLKYTFLLIHLLSYETFNDPHHYLLGTVKNIFTAVTYFMMAPEGS